MFYRLPMISRGKLINFEADGREIAAFEGETVATALLSSGILQSQINRGRALGPFCNIGQCFSCLMNIDGVNGVRACRTEVKAGMKVQTKVLE